MSSSKTNTKDKSDLNGPMAKIKDIGWTLTENDANSIKSENDEMISSTNSLYIIDYNNFEDSFSYCSSCSNINENEMCAHAQIEDLTEFKTEKLPQIKINSFQNSSIFSSEKSFNKKNNMEKHLTEPFHNNNASDGCVLDISPFMCTENENKIENTQPPHVPIVVKSITEDGSFVKEAYQTLRTENVNRKNYCLKHLETKNTSKDQLSENHKYKIN